MNAVVPECHEPVRAFRYRFDAAARIGAGSEGGIVVGRRLLVARERIGIEFHIHRCIGNGVIMVGGLHTNFGGQRNRVGRFPAGKDGKEQKEG